MTSARQLKTITTPHYITQQWRQFDLVCDRHWLRSFLSSSALAGMLISSVTLGLLSDRFGRLRCLQVGMAISIVATVAAMLVPYYFLLNLCFMLMSYAQVGAANALCTLLMEATSPRFRYVPVFEYGIGWGLGTLIVPALNELTKDYRLFLLATLVWQLAMLPWLHFGIFESIRWLLTEGHTSRAQIELRRACRMNRVQTNVQLAQEIANIQKQQVRKATRVIDQELAANGAIGAQDLEKQLAQHELSMINAAVKRTFGFDELDQEQVNELEAELKLRHEQDDERDAEADRLAADGVPPMPRLSPTLARRLYSVTCIPDNQLPTTNHQINYNQSDNNNNNKLNGQPCQELVPSLREPRPSMASLQSSQSRHSIPALGLAELAMRYSRNFQQQNEGSCFLVQMFHKKLWRQTLVLLILSIMFEVAYYGFVQTYKNVGSSVSLNYLVGGLTEWAAAVLVCALMTFFRRQPALILPTLVTSLACLGMAISYHLIPDTPGARPNFEPRFGARNIEIGAFMDQLDSAVLNDTITVAPAKGPQTNSIIGWLADDPLAFRQSLNFYLMLVGKFAVTVAIQVCATISMELYPSNLRQTGSGAILFCGRIGSIGSPFLFNDTSPDRTVFKVTLVGLAVLGVAMSALVPLWMADNKDKDLCDHIHEIEDKKPAS